MKTTTSPVSLAGLLMSGLCAGGCQQSQTPNTLVQSQPQQPNTSIALTQSKPLPKPKRTKKVEVSIKDINSTGVDSASTSFAIGPNSNPTVTVYWNGYGFICKDDSGQTFWQCSNDLAFKGKPKADFVIKKKVSITEEDGSVTRLTTSDAVSVKRGIPQHFFQDVFPKNQTRSL